MVDKGVTNWIFSSFFILDLLVFSNDKKNNLQAIAIAIASH